VHALHLKYGDAELASIRIFMRAHDTWRWYSIHVRYTTREFDMATFKKDIDIELYDHEVEISIDVDDFVSEEGVDDVVEECIR
jgi:hypothetical protein